MGHKKSNDKFKDFDVKWNFDIDNNREEQFHDQYISGGIEFKSESYENWSRNNNVFIEYAQIDGRFSGIEVTKASLWVHALYGEDGELVQVLYIPTKSLKEMIRTGKYRQVVSNHIGTTDMRTWGYLIPIKDILEKINPLLDLLMYE